jgi:hypothetical protein
VECNNFELCTDDPPLQGCDCIGGFHAVLDFGVMTATRLPLETLANTSGSDIMRCNEGYADSALCSLCETPRFAFAREECLECTQSHLVYVVNALSMVLLLFPVSGA